MVAIDDFINPIESLFGIYPLGPFLLAILSILLALHPTLLSLSTAIGGLGLSALMFYVQAQRNKVTQEFRWYEQIVVVTGAANGVGKELCHVLADKFRAKYIVALDVKPCDFSHPRIRSFVCDVTKYEQVKQIAEEVRKSVILFLIKCGAPTVLVNNAGVVVGKAFADLSDQEMNLTVNVNLLGVMYCTKAFLPDLLSYKQGGHLIHMASVLGLTGNAMVSDYCASKFGVVGFHQSIRQEYKHTYFLLLTLRNLKMSAFYPGLIDTGMFHGVQQNEFLTPRLNPKHVAEKIARVIESQRSNEVCLPAYVAQTPFLSLFPNEVLDHVRDALKANEDMKKFIGGKR